MLRRRFLQSAALSPLALTAFSPSLEASGRDVSGDISARVGSDSPMRQRFELTLKRVLSGDEPAYTEDFVLEDVRPTAGRRFTEYSGDVSGRYIGALATASRVYGIQFPRLDKLVEKTIAFQKPDGYFGSAFHYEKPTDLDLALLWGNGRLLVGLLEYYRLRASPGVLAACVRLGDWLVRIGPLMLSEQIRGEFGAQHFASSYICWTQQTEGLANLFAMTKDARYRKLVESIAAVTERRPSDHVHGYLTSVRGWIDLARATGNAELLSKSEAAWEDVASSKDLLITGGVPEGWSPNNHRTEGCGEADWLRLSLALWKATGKAKYLEMAERTTFNEFAFNQYASGDFGHRVYTETGLPAGGAVRAWWCCTLHGLRAFPDVQSSVFRREEGGLAFDLPVGGRVEGGASEIAATAYSSLASNGQVRIRIDKAGPDFRLLRIRKPGWAESMTVQVNGKAQDHTVAGNYLRIERLWQPGDVITVHYAMALRREAAGKERMAYWVGPWLLGAPASENGAYFNEMTTENRLGEFEKATNESANRGAASHFEVPIAARVASYVPAEFPEQPGKASLRAIAEQTGQATTSWELRFLNSVAG